MLETLSNKPWILLVAMFALQIFILSPIVPISEHTKAVNVLLLFGAFMLALVLVYVGPLLWNQDCRAEFNHQLRGIMRQSSFIPSLGLTVGFILLASACMTLGRTLPALLR